jgi:hypothetical protein
MGRYLKYKLQFSHCTRLHFHKRADNAAAPDLFAFNKTLDKSESDRELHRNALYVYTELAGSTTMSLLNFAWRLKKVEFYVQNVIVFYR